VSDTFRVSDSRTNERKIIDLQHRRANTRVKIKYAQRLITSRYSDDYDILPGMYILTLIKQRTSTDRVRRISSPALCTTRTQRVPIISFSS